MAKGTVYITARSAEPKDVYDAVAGWTAGFDTLDDAKAHGLTLSQKAVVELKFTKTSLRHADMLSLRLSTSCTHRAARFTARIRRCLTLRMTRLTIRYRFMRRPRKATSFSPTHTASCTTFLRQDLDFSRCTDLPDDLTWLTSDSPTSSSRERQFRSSTTATASATSHMWMTSLRV